MCNQFRTLQQLDLFEQTFGVPLPDGEWREEVYPGYLAPIVRKPRGGPPGSRESVLAKFGLIPAKSKTQKLEFSTMNARVDRIQTARSYKGPFTDRQWCIIPSVRFYEPYYDLEQWALGNRRSERFGISRADGQPVGIAGLWELWKRHPDDEEGIHSFTMVTLNADKHPLLHRFHRPFDNQGNPEEKRTVALLREAQFDAWLDTSPSKAPDFFHTFPAEDLVAAPFPEPPRPKKPTVTKAMPAPLESQVPQLGFDFD
ncbi:SOS response-associated peptidase family protein [Aquabacterium sp.]|uniref:SOS response-associated peptidase n=1 Tax=Aquabacterium sp. TaxID=1872578 RepID=UPI00199BDDA9|nr:SOS response-associated peptidase family protein [Aquabacterium sp.]MBC7699676.1 SOS response-associated peptidase family protein [Aquabacterium sp.]